MKKILMVLAVICFLTSFPLAQKAQKIPSITVDRLDGKKVNTASFSNADKPILIVFWASWDAVGKKALNEIAEKYEDWQKETGVKLIAVSIDDARSVSKVAPYVQSKSWEYEVYLDQNGDFKRAMNVNNIPHTFLINGKGEIVWSMNHYSPGDEDKIYENVKKVKNGEEITE